MVFETQDQLNESLAEWQRILRVQDWDVDAKIVRRDDLDTGEERRCGSIWQLAKKRHATIKLLDPVDWVGDSGGQDHEITLVHELLHIHTRRILEAGDTDETGQWDRMVNAEEPLVHHLSVALVNLRRSGK